MHQVEGGPHDDQSTNDEDRGSDGRAREQGEKQCNDRDVDRRWRDDAFISAECPPPVAGGHDEKGQFGRGQRPQRGDGNLDRLKRDQETGGRHRPPRRAYGEGHEGNAHQQGERGYGGDAVCQGCRDERERQHQRKVRPSTKAAADGGHGFTVEDPRWRSRLVSG